MDVYMKRTPAQLKPLTSKKTLEQRVWLCGGRCLAGSGAEGWTVHAGGEIRPQAAARRPVPFARCTNARHQSVRCLSAGKARGGGGQPKQ